MDDNRIKRTNQTMNTLSDCIYILCCFGETIAVCFVVFMSVDGYIYSSGWI